MKKIAHITSVHQRDDVRIVIKECRTLVAAGYDTSLLVADGLGSATDHGINIIDVGASNGGRLHRMMATRREIQRAASDIEADIYHLHDPELLPVAAHLKKNGAIVIFDSHEDHVQDLLYKEYLPGWAKPAISSMFSAYQTRVCRQLDAIVAATPAICDIFQKLGCRAETIANYPDLAEFEALERPQKDSDKICYVGTISSIRAFPELIDVIAQCRQPIGLDLAGDFNNADIEAQCRNSVGWNRVTFHGHVGRPEVANLLNQSFAGIVTLLPTTTHLESLPIKLFEYMAAGVPVIASNFPLWEKIIQESGSGISVDPTDGTAIANAIETLHSNQEAAREKGECGRIAVKTQYNWQSQGRRLIELYKSLIGI